MSMLVLAGVMAMAACSEDTTAPNQVPQATVLSASGNITAKVDEGTAIHDFMPWRIIRNMPDDDLAALWHYLRSVPPKPFGGK